MDLIGKQLPSVSAADNGKVLGVENGNWRAITPATPSNMVYIPYQDLNFYSIQETIAAGKTPFTKHTVQLDDYTFYLMQNVKASVPSKFVFVCVTQDFDNANVFQMHFLQVYASNKVTATTLFYDKEFIETLQGNIASLYGNLRLNLLRIDVSGSTATLNLTAEGGIQALMVKYLAGANLQFTAYGTQNSPSNLLFFTVCGLSQDRDNLHVDLSCVSDGRAYYVRLIPVDTNVMRGTLYTYTLPAST